MMKTIFLTGISRGLGSEIFKLLRTSFEIIGTTRNKKNFADKHSDVSAEQLNSIIELDLDIGTNCSWDEYLNKLVPMIDSIDKNIDVFINNSGVAHFMPFHNLGSDAIRNEFFVNSIAPTIILNRLIPKMIENRRGLIINISSVAAKKTFENASIYSATKTSIITLTNSIREEIRKYNIKIVNIFLGATDTEIWDEEIRNAHNSRMIKPENVAQIIKQIIYFSDYDDLMIEELIIKPQLGDL